MPMQSASTTTQDCYEKGIHMRASVKNIFTYLVRRSTLQRNKISPQGAKSFPLRWTSFLQGFGVQECKLEVLWKWPKYDKCIHSSFITFKTTSSFNSFCMLTTNTMNFVLLLDFGFSLLPKVSFSQICLSRLVIHVYPDCQDWWYMYT